MSDIQVSVVIPAFNVENYISHTLSSVLSQTLKNFECIIIDDFSNDNTKKICTEFIKNDKRFKLIPHRANGGLSAARNTGLRAARGKYICFLDSDDLMMHDSLETRANTLNSSKDPKVIGTYCGSNSIDEICELPPKSTPANLKKVDFITAGGNCPFNANQPMFIREKFIELGGFDHSLKQAEDYDMWIRALRHGYIILPTQVNAVTYRATPGSMIKRDPMLHLQTSFDRFMSCYEKVDIREKPVDSYDYNVFLDKGLPDYSSQLNISNRVLEFVGIALSVGKEFGLAQKLVNYLPDYFKIIESHRPFVNGLIKGINRGLGYNINNNPEALNKFILKIEKLRCEFITLSESITHDEEEIHHGQLCLGKTNFEVSSGTLVSQHGGQSLIDIVFIPHKDYHVATIDMIQGHLTRLGLKFIVVDISMHYRDEGIKRKAQELDLPLIGYSNFLLGKFTPKLIVCFNDWDPIVRAIIVSAQKAGIATSAIVEGIQDYEDADTKQTRWAYRTVDYVFLPGKFDEKYFINTGQNVQAVGIPRIHALRNKNKTELNWSQPKALINSNFSYGVLEDVRDQWVIDAVEACLSAGFEPIISRHPADLGTEHKDYQTNANFYDAIKHCSVHISKFASGILESLAIGCPVIYFNPHDEKVDKFKEPLGAYPIANSKKQLIDNLKTLEKNSRTYLEKSENFLNIHAGYAEDSPAEQLSLELQSIIKKQTNQSSIKFNQFKNSMLDIDKKTGCFNNIKYLRDAIDATYKDSTNTLAKKSTDALKNNTNFKTFTQLIKEKKYHKACTVLEKLLTTYPELKIYKRSAFDLYLAMKTDNEKPPKWIKDKLLSEL